jgi:uncharacterized protein (TIGR02147 family)
MEPPNIYQYLDYRAYLKDLFEFRKQKSKNFSYRYFSGKAGFASPNFLKLVIDGERNITNESIAKIAKGFGLNKQEREFLENLAFMNQASDHDGTDHYYKKMMAMRGFVKIHQLEKNRYTYFSKWYYPVVREVIMFGDRKHNPAQIAVMLKPPITPKEAEKALKLLSDLELINQDEDGIWSQNEQAISTGPEVKSLLAAKFHKAMIAKAVEALDRLPAAERDISGVTISINHNRISDIKKKVAAFRKELLELACNDQDPPTQVLQVNLQVFSLSSLITGEE